jgi:hypothetical protein
MLVIQVASMACLHSHKLVALYSSSSTKELLYLLEQNFDHLVSKMLQEAFKIVKNLFVDFQVKS